MIVLLMLMTGIGGLYRLADRSNRYRDAEPLFVLVTDAADVQPGTPVRLRGIETGQVTQVEYAADGVRLELHIDPKTRHLLFADARATVKSKGIFGSSVIDISPGHPTSGPLESNELHASTSPDLSDVTKQLATIANRVDSLLADVQSGKGTLPKLLKDETIYNDLKEVTADTKKLVKNLDQSVTAMRSDAQKTLTKVDRSVDEIHGEMDGLKTFVRQGQEAVTALKQDAEAIKAMPIVRSYVEDANAILVRPDCERDRIVWVPEMLFEPQTSILTVDGKKKLDEAAGWFNSQTQKNSEIVVAVFDDPKIKDRTSAASKTLTKKQAEAITEYLKNRGVHKMGFIARRKVTPLGLGMEPSPVIEKEKLAPARVELILLIPR